MVVFKQPKSLWLLLHLRRSISQSVLHLRATFTLIISPSCTRPNEESHDGNGTCTKEEDKWNIHRVDQTFAQEFRSLTMTITNATILRSKTRTTMRSRTTLIFRIQLGYQGPSCEVAGAEEESTLRRMYSGLLDVQACYDSTHRWSLRCFNVYFNYILVKLMQPGLTRAQSLIRVQRIPISKHVNKLKNKQTPIYILISSTGAVKDEIHTFQWYRRNCSVCTAYLGQPGKIATESKSKATSSTFKIHDFSSMLDFVLLSGES